MTQTNYWFIFHQDHLLLTKQGNEYVPLTTLPDDWVCQYQHSIGMHHQQHIHCALLAAMPLTPDDIITLPLRKALNTLHPTWYGMAVRAYSIIKWDKNNQFCGHCGTPTQHKTGIFERICPACQLVLYPRISPSVIVRIKRGDQILMARSPHFTPGAYGLIAGFVEVGETLEEAVHREVKEEVSLTITNLQYYASQPWPFPDSLMVGFTADYLDGEIIIDPHEIEEAGWYSKEKIPGWPSSSVSISRQLIEDFVKQG